MQFAIVIAQTPNTYSAYAPDVTGCGATGATGATVADVKQVLAEALVLHLAGETVPALTTTVDSIEVAREATERFTASCYTTTIRD